MLKLKIILAAALLVVLASGGWWMSPAAAHRPTTHALIPAPPAKPVTFYRWQDKDGLDTWSSEPPPAGTPYTTATTDGVLSTMDAYKLPDAPASAASDEVNPLRAYTPGGMQEVLQQAKQAAQMMEQAQAQRERQIQAQQ